jgi:dimethylargininase
LGKPEFNKALNQHQLYSQALEACGLSITILEADPDFPDGVFVEDVAVLTERACILTNPGAASRLGEKELIRPLLKGLFDQLFEITAPGTLDGGDICQAEDHFFIGLSERTNSDGALQLAGFLQSLGFHSSIIDLHGLPGLLHLKSGLAYLGEHNLIIVPELANQPAFAGYRCLLVDPLESYAANCLRLNDTVLIADGFPGTRMTLEQAGYRLAILNMSEFQKMDGGLSCLSLRF